MKRLGPAVGKSHSAAISAADERAFAAVVDLIHVSRERVVAAVNSALIDLYWRASSSRRRLKRMVGGKARSPPYPHTFGRGIRDYRGSRLRTCGACGSSSRLTGTAQISQRC